MVLSVIPLINQVLARIGEASPDLFGRTVDLPTITVDDIPKDAIAKLGAEAMNHGIDHDMGAKHAKWFVTSAKTTGWLRETELVPKTQGVVSSIKEMGFAMNLLRRGKVPPPVPPHVAKDVGEARALYDLVKAQGRDGAAGIVQSEKALLHLEFDEAEKRDPYGEGSFPKPKPLPGDAGEEKTE